jgi:hypothetical protein
VNNTALSSDLEVKGVNDIYKNNGSTKIGGTKNKQTSKQMNK